MKIEIITAENEKLKENGFGSLAVCTNILNTLKVTYDNTRMNICKSEEDLEKVLKRRPDLVILAVKYIELRNKSNILLCDYFKKHNINYTGCEKDVLKYDSNKVLAKSFLRRKGINTADYFIAMPKEYKEKEFPLEFPVFLKPVNTSNSYGIDEFSLANNFKEYESKILSLYTQFKEPILVEKYLDGREFTVAIIKKDEKELLVSAIEILAPLSNSGNNILSEKVKRENSEKLLIIEDTLLKNKIEKIAQDSFMYLDIRDYGRIDIKMNKVGECFFLEANLIPGMNERTDYFPRAFKLTQDLNYDNILEMMVESAIQRVSVINTNNIDTVN
ncbi:D-alanine--D-alanine ligase domain protein [Arcobacter nitrofigilis DSM 7299]|uniref:D-alanine--D-alanine ligase domain protein n=1 Tax=Arcobacter nitrofigilis (strain ATCC 33309 / DSM 7299 / CCUG 15893 / LMG 7604 / NCTC 12251 / CI) TaxID=572480 RepID=D5V193_ARCNC|nr:D-alanine--D-alanine ligase [Arcobacter nitrofigilis]ADG94055.1 D-alanine--D-alanine ligase domain protein [Arcobacter nitrofigilis DSM 7299]